MQSSFALKWLRFNLFAKPFDVALTVLVVPSLAWFLLSFLQWVFGSAQWDAIRSSAKVLMTGIFPADQLWRAWFAAGIIGSALALTASSAVPMNGRRIVAGMLGVAAITALAAFVHSDAALNALACAGVPLVIWALASQSRTVRENAGLLSAIICVVMIAVVYPAGPSNWGGLLLSVILTIISAILTIPFGILLAFGRQSKIGSVRTLATAYIEVMRAVPLILIVYLIWISQPLLLPGLQVPDVVRGLIGFVLFYAAYAAEYIRSGLQAVPRGQIEAAESLGFSSLDVKRMVILPQAMRVAMPGLVGNTLDIFNYAPLVFIIGLTDFLRAGQMVLANPQNSGQTYEIYVFLFVVYFAIGSIITFMARRLERYLGKGSLR